MKKILMISTHGYFEAEPSLGKADTGGQVVFVIELSKALAKAGYSVDILSRKFGSLKETERINKDVKIIRFPCGGNKFIPKEYLVEYLPELEKAFMNYVKRNKPNYQFIDSHYWDAGFLGEKLKKKLGISHFFTPHSSGIWKENRLKEALKKSGEFNKEALEKKYNFKKRNSEEKRIMEDCNRVIATTPQQKEMIIKDYGIKEEKIKMITPGFDPEKFRKTDKVLNMPERFVFSAGRLSESKGYDLLVKAMQYVSKEVPEARLVFAIGSKKMGKNEKLQKKKILSLAKDLGLNKKVIFLNYLENLEDFYSASEVFVLPSSYEPFGMTAIEAMACKTPTVVTSKGGLKFFLKDGHDAMIANPFNSKELARKITLLLKDEKLKKKVIENGYKKAHSIFTWDKITNKTLKTVKEAKKEKLLCTDMDGTFIGSKKAMSELLKIINDNNFYLVFSTGRDLEMVNDFIKKENIQKPHGVICMVGTEIYLLRNGEMVSEKEWEKIISKNWDRKRAEEALRGIKGLKLQEKERQTKNKLSYFVKNESAFEEAREKLKKEGIKANAIYSANEFLDIIPERSGKGKALKYLIKKMGIKKDNVAVAGDSGNDIDLFRAGFKGIIVGNAHKELKNYKGEKVYKAKSKYSKGIIEGIDKIFKIR